MGTRKGIRYLNVACSFDIETSSFYQAGEKRACMYIWMFAVNDVVITGRTWDEFETLIYRIGVALDLEPKRRIVVYVHNLGYEFQWIRKHFEWLEVFALKQREPLYAVTTSGVEFRCSYLLSGYSLEKLGDTLKDAPRKLVGNLDYSKLRHSGTPLSDAEMAYCVNDVLVVTAYIRQQMEKDGDITKIPLTKTGYVRNFCRTRCLGTHTKPNKSYRNLIGACRMTPGEYDQLRNVYSGGFTHASAWNSGKTLVHVGSYDFTSSYPAVMLAEMFPMGTPRVLRVENEPQIDELCIDYACMWDVRFTGLRPRIPWEHYISYSKCWDVVGCVRDNGRVVRADVLNTSICDCDWSIIKEFYSWDTMEIANFRAYRKDYLPRPFMDAILSLYEMKTKLKGVEGMEYEYMQGKGMINSAYGMCVTSPTRDEITYSDDVWGSVEPDVRDALKRHNDAKSRFLYYPWGVWVTAYARRNLFTGIAECGEDYVYSDTDSIKTLNRESHLTYFADYNNWIVNRIKDALEYRELDPARAEPCTIDGKPKPLGVWDYEGTYTFKTLGAKRYLMRDESTGRLTLTVSGVSKSAVEYLEGEDAFERFAHGLDFPREVTGKLTHTYIDTATSGDVVDYLGNPGHYSELSSVHLEPTGYSMGLAEEYRRYLMGINYDYE